MRASIAYLSLTGSLDNRGHSGRAFREVGENRAGSLAQRSSEKNHVELSLPAFLSLKISLFAHTSMLIWLASVKRFH